MGKTIEADSSKSKTVTKKKYDDVLTKVIIRRLPPTLHKDVFLQELREVFPEGFPEHDYFRFCGSDLSFSPVPFSRAYINFKNAKEILNFKEKLDGYIFTDGKGGKYPVVVEFAPFQGVPKKTRKRKDIKSATIEKDADYLSFLETLQQDVEPLPSAEVYLEQQEANKQSMKEAKMTTPLIEFLKIRKASGKSRNSSQRSSASSSNGGKRKPPKETGKGGFKNSFPEKGARSHSAGDSSKKGNERKKDEFKGSRATTPARGSEKKNEKPRESKEKDQSEEKEKTPRKDRPSSAKTWKESRPQDENNKTGSNPSRPQSAYRTPRRGLKETSRAKENIDKARPESRPSSATASSNEERKPQRQARDDKERVRNKDRPAQAIYQPRSRPARANTEETTPRNSGRPQSAKDQGRGFRDSKDRDNPQRGRDNSARDRDYRDSNRNRETQKSTRAKSDDTTKE